MIVDFAIAMLTAFRNGTWCGRSFGDVYMIPNLVGSDMIKSSAMPPDRIDLPFDVHETLPVIRGQERSFTNQLHTYCPKPLDRP